MNLSEEDMEDITDMVIDSRDIEAEPTADEMFEKLNLNKEINNDRYVVYGDEESSIIFDKQKREIGIQNLRYFDLKLIKAINKKVEELGWNETSND